MQMTQTKPEIRSPKVTITPAIGENHLVCPECSATTSLSLESAHCPAACRGCGQCVQSEQPFGVTDWSLVKPQWPLKHKKAGGTVGVMFGAAMILVGFVPVIPFYIRSIIAMVGAALVFEGLGRLIAKSKENKPRAAVLGDNERPKEELGRLKAIFATENSLTDSLAVLSLAGAFVLGAIWAINWTLAGGAPAKLVLLAFILPVAAAFLIFGAVKLYLARKMFYVYDHGFRYVAGNKSVEHRWTNIYQMSAIHLGDAIHEDAINFMFRNGDKELRITRGNFASLETIWCRLAQESEEQIQDGKLSIIVVEKSE